MKIIYIERRAICRVNLMIILIKTWHNTNLYKKLHKKNSITFLDVISYSGFNKFKLKLELLYVTALCGQNKS